MIIHGVYDGTMNYTWCLKHGDYNSVKQQIESCGFVTIGVSYYSPSSNEYSFEIARYVNVYDDRICVYSNEYSCEHAVYPDNTIIFSDIG